jgi:hypothetical protein
VPTETAKPAEQLLGAVADEGDADDGSEQEQTGIHGGHPSTYR